MNRTTLFVAAAVAALALFATGFWAGANTREATVVSSAGTSGAGAGGTTTVGGAGGPGGAGGALRVAGGGANLPTTGRVISVNADSITVAVTPPRAPGSSASPGPQTSTIALVGASTRIVRTSETDVRLSDIKAGDQVTIVGTQDQNSGTLSAQAIVVGFTNVLGQLFGGGQGGPGGPGGAGAPRPGGSPAGR